jgi:hypothetical protein
MDNWKAESADMYLVYSNAKLCIAATAAPNGDAGLFFDRDPSMRRLLKPSLSFLMNP